MKNVISKKVRRKMLNLIEQITDNSFISIERDTLLNNTDDSFFEYVFDQLNLKSKRDMDVIRLLYMKLNLCLAEIDYEIYIENEDILENKYLYNYRKRRTPYKKIPFYVECMPKEYPAFYLTSDNWDDYSHKTTFYLNFCNNKEEEVIYIGAIKILDVENYRAIDTVPKEFYELDSNFYSLGQSIDFYTKLSFLVPNYEVVLKALNDIAIDPQKEEEVREKDRSGFENSLIRFSEARMTLDEIFKNEIQEKTFSFNYEFWHMNYGRGIEQESPIDITFNFDKDEILPYRINAIIGKNGVGKTQIIKNLSEELSGMRFSDDEEFGSIFEAIEEKKQYPDFSKIITVSYSAFDNFRKMENKEKIKFNYVYCGLYKSERGEDKRLSVDEIKGNIIEAKQEIANRGRTEEWFNCVKLMSESTDMVGMIEKAEFSEDIQLSSGELVILSCITDIIKYISEQSLILFDEPELHLHPNAVSNFMKMLNSILDAYNSYSIISTHSPIIIQEISSRSVNIILREADYTFVRRLGIECFGETIDNINKDVFYFDNSSLNYKKRLENVIQNKSYEEINKQFEDKLGLNTKIYLKTLENQKEQ